MILTTLNRTVTSVMAGRLRTTLLAASVSALSTLAGVSLAIAASPDPGKVVIKDFMFQPTAVSVAAGSTVTWTNQDDEPHTVISDTGLFRSPALDTNDTFTFKFDKAGTYHFTCSIHPRMVGTIVVTQNP
jgi:plastocyanin